MIYYPKGDYFSTQTLCIFLLSAKQNTIGTLKPSGSWPKTKSELESLHALCARESVEQICWPPSLPCIGEVLFTCFPLCNIPHLHLLKCQLSLKIQFKHHRLYNTLLQPLTSSFKEQEGLRNIGNNPFFLLLFFKPGTGNLYVLILWKFTMHILNIRILFCINIALK